MASESTTPNIGLQIPGFNQANWQVPIQYDLNRLDLIFGGSVQVPALSVGVLTAANLNFAILLTQEVPAGAIPGTVYTLSQVPQVIIAFVYNGAVQRLNIDYTVSGAVVTLNFSTVAGDTVYAIYFT
jgi:hypothetical protein